MEGEGASAAPGAAGEGRGCGAQPGGGGGPRGGVRWSRGWRGVPGGVRWSLRGPGRGPLVPGRGRCAPGDPRGGPGWSPGVSGGPRGCRGSPGVSVGPWGSREGSGAPGGSPAGLWVVPGGVGGPRGCPLVPAGPRGCRGSPGDPRCGPGWSQGVSGVPGGVRWSRGVSGALVGVRWSQGVSGVPGGVRWSRGSREGSGGPGGSPAGLWVVPGVSGVPGGVGGSPGSVAFLPDGSGVPLPLEPPPGPTAGELLRRLQGALRLPPAAPGLALWLGSPLLEVQLKPRHRPLRLVRQWPELLLRYSLGTAGDIERDEPCLQLRRNVFFPKSKELEVEDEGVLRLLYEEARGRVLGGRYPVDPPMAEELGALSCRLRLGPFDPAQHTAASLRPLLGELLPPTPGRGGLWGALLRRGPRSPPPEEGLLRAYARTPGPQTPPAALYRAFLRLCHRLPYYGCAFFPGAIDRPPGGLLGRGGLRPVSVAVGLEGVTIIDPREKHVLLTLTFPELCWELVGAVGQEGGDTEGQEEGGDAEGPPQLWLEFDGDHEGAPVNRLLRVCSPQAELMSALIECCIELGAQAPPPGEEAPPPGNEAPPPGDEAPPPGRAPPQRQQSVTRPRPQRLATIDYVREGQELRRVKPPRRAASFFGRGGGSYGPVPGGAGLEQG
ncbi:FERM domain-containing protein 8 [Podargus strigoides]